MASRSQLQALQTFRHYGLGRLLLLARQDFLARLAVRMGGENEAVMQARGRLLPYVDVDGTRSVDLASRMGVSKQAVGRMVKELEEEGLLYRQADDADGRAFLVKFTEEGLDYLVRMHRTISRIERDYERLIGPERMRLLRESLSLVSCGTAEEDRKKRRRLA